MPANQQNERLRRNLARVRATIAEACQRSARDPADVRLIAVTKLLAAGMWELGENRCSNWSAGRLPSGPPT